MRGDDSCSLDDKAEFNPSDELAAVNYASNFAQDLARHACDERRSLGAIPKRQTRATRASSPAPWALPDRHQIDERTAAWHAHDARQGAHALPPGLQVPPNPIPPIFPSPGNPNPRVLPNPTNQNPPIHPNLRNQNPPIFPNPAHPNPPIFPNPANPNPPILPNPANQHPPIHPNSRNQNPPVDFRFPPPPYTPAASPNRGHEDLIRALLEDNRRRDIAMQELITQLVNQGNRGGNNANNDNPAQMSYSILPDLSHTIGMFSGETGAQMAREWLEGIESTAALHRWPENFALQTARTHLQAGARDWYFCHRQTLNNWETFRAQFYETFVTPESFTARWNRMISRTQGKQESLTTYFHAKTRLCQSVRLGFQDTKEQILVGLWSKDLCNTMQAREQFDTAALLKDMQEYERLESQRLRLRGIYPATKITRSSTTATTTGPTDTSSQARTTTSRPPGRTADPRPPLVNERGQTKCYNCNLYGHLSRDCTEPKRELRCLKCNRTGHTQRHCPDGGTTARASPTTASIAAPGVNFVASDNVHSARTYVKPLEINGHPMTGFIDTGSSDCTIKASRVLQFNLRFENQPETLHCFGPQHNQVLSPGAVRATIVIDGVTVEQVALRVVPDDCQAHDALIGRTFIDAPGVTYAKNHDELRFFAEPAFAGATIPRPVVTQPVEIPPRTIQFVQVRAGNEELWLPMLNSGATPKKVDEGTKIEKCALSTTMIIERHVPRAPIVREDVDVGEGASENEVSE